MNSICTVHYVGNCQFLFKNHENFLRSQKLIFQFNFWFDMMNTCVRSKFWCTNLIRINGLKKQKQFIIVGKYHTKTATVSSQLHTVGDLFFQTLPWLICDHICLLIWHFLHTDFSIWILFHIQSQSIYNSRTSPKFSNCTLNSPCKYKVEENFKISWIPTVKFGHSEKNTKFENSST